MKNKKQKAAKSKPIVVEHVDEIEDSLKDLDLDEEVEEDLDEDEFERQEREYMEKHGIKRKNLLEDDDKD